MGVVSTIRDKCKRCYACIRNCPAKAIKVKEGQAEVMEERCIACGTCVRVCAQQAKQIESYIDVVEGLLAQDAPVIAILAPSFPAAFPGVRPGQMVTALKKLGFSEVMEVAFGAQLVAREYTRLVGEDGVKPLITTPCPALVSYIEKHCPELIEYLAPIVSPMIAMGRVIKWQYRPEAKVIFIGPCIAKKAERKDPKVAGVIDAAPTFAELKGLLAKKGIDPLLLEESPFSGPRPHLARMFPVSGGLLRAAGLSSDILEGQVVVTEGKERVLEVLQEFAQGRLKARFFDLLFCEGCINGPVMDNELSFFTRKEIITDYTLREADPIQTEKDLETYAGINLRREFTNQSIPLPHPSEEDIREILRQINKTKPEDELNCGACGYNSCREKAVAVYQGLAENEMCWPYLVQRLEATQASLIQAEKLTSLGQMAAAIAHEINNPLAGVLVYTKLLSKKLGGDGIPKETAIDYLSKMETEITRSSRIIRSLLDFARQSEPLVRLVDINQTVERALSLVEHQAQLQNIEVIKEFTPSLPRVKADFDQLQQVFTNLILNAIQAMLAGGRLTVRTTLVTERKPPAGKLDMVRVDVQDTGYGIPRENLNKLFTPFFTTKEKGKGVGLGLAVVYGIIQRHQGRIEVQSEVGKGSTFTVYLGASDEEKG